MFKNPAKITRVLVVEDHELFRKFVSIVTQQAPELQIIAEVSDGLAAVQAAEELQPDLILLDICLPIFNGLEAARQIRKIAPESKILFLTHESGDEVVQQAFRSGAKAYVLKTDAGSELMLAIKSVLRGEKFASSGCLGHKLSALGAAVACDSTIVGN